MKVLIFANCQGKVLVQLLPKVIDVVHFNNFHYINHTNLDITIKEHLITCDYFIYQPLSSIYPVYNIENLKTYLKHECKIISFPYIFNDAFSPIFKSLKRDIPINGEYSLENTSEIIYKNKESIIVLKELGLCLEQIFELYDNNKIDFKYQERFERSLKILEDKEKYTDIKVSQFILDNHKKYKLFNYHLPDHKYTFCNHPSNILIIYYTNQIFNLMGLEKISYDGPELINGTMLVSRYDIAYYNYDWIDKESEDIDFRVKNIIREIYEKF